MILASRSRFGSDRSALGKWRTTTAAVALAALAAHDLHSMHTQNLRKELMRRSKQW
jgi:hypothetical protein